MALEKIRHYGLSLIGLHMHIGSGVDYAHLSSVCEAMVELVKTADVDIQAISAGADYQRHIVKMMKLSILTIITIYGTVHVNVLKHIWNIRLN